MTEIVFQVLAASIMVSLFWLAWKIVEKLFRKRLRMGFCYGVSFMLAMRLIIAVIPIPSSVREVFTVNEVSLNVMQTSYSTNENSNNITGNINSNSQETVNTVTPSNVKKSTVNKTQLVDTEKYSVLQKLNHTSSKLKGVITRFWLHYNKYLVITWISGFMFFMLLFLVRYWWIMFRLELNSYIITIKDVNCLLEECGMEVFGPKRKLPRIKIIKRYETPFVMGIRKPVLYLPQSIMKELPYLSEEMLIELRHQILHELIHIRHRDLLAKILFIIAKAIHWFNPVVWSLQKIANQQMELWCDEAVVEQMGKEERFQYSGLLLKTLERTGKDRYSLSTQFSGGAKRVKQRLENIMIMEKRRRLIIMPVLMSGCIVASVFMFSYQEKIMASTTNNMENAGDSYSYIDTTIESLDGVKESYSWKFVPTKDTIEQPPEIQVSVYGQTLDYGLVLNNWKEETAGKVKQTPDFFATQTQRGDKIPCFFTKTVSDEPFKIIFNGKVPQAVEVTDVVLDENGNHKYPGMKYEVIHRQPAINGNEMEFNLGEHATIWFYEDWVNAQELRKPFYRGYEITCYWESEECIQSATYLLMVRTIPLKYSYETIEQVKELNGYNYNLEQ